MPEKPTQDNQPATPPKKQQTSETQKRKRRFPFWARLVLLFLGIFIVVGVLASLTWYQVAIAPELNNITNKRAIRHTTPQPDNSGNVLTGKRLNILLLGSDTDDKFKDGSPLAQTVIIVTVDPSTKYVGMISIPRDMQISEMDDGRWKLDEAFMLGYKQAKANASQAEKIATASGHMMDILEHNYGIKIDHYAWVGLEGFVKVINTAGGVDVDVLQPLVDDTYPDDVQVNHGDTFAYKRVYIAPGPQHLDGVQALEYVRTRHADILGDFGRSQRQQQVLNQLKTKLATPAMINKASELLQNLNGAVQTDLDINQIIQIGNLARQIDTNKVERATLSPPTYSFGLENGSGNFAPNCPEVITTLNKMLAITTAKCLPQANAGNGNQAKDKSPTNADQPDPQQPDNTTPPNDQQQPGNITPPIQQPGQSQPENSNQSKNQQPGNTTSGNLLTQVSSSPLLNPADGHFVSIHALLDLMFMPVFESFEAGKV